MRLKQNKSLNQDIYIFILFFLFHEMNYSEETKYQELKK